MKQKLTLYSMILILLEIISLFIPYCFTVNHWKYDSSSFVYHGHQSLEIQENINLFDTCYYTAAKMESTAKAGAVLVILSLLLSFCFLFLSMLQDKKSIIKIKNLDLLCFLSPVISLVLFVVFSIYICIFAELDTTNWRYECTVNWLYYIIIGFHLLTIVFTALIRFKRFESEPLPTESRGEQLLDRIPAISFGNTEEIRKYKELLDSGIITQEEFDAKKKQLLEL